MARRWLLVFLILALPFQGAFAASRLCLAIHTGAPSLATEGEHAHHGSGHHAHGRADSHHHDGDSRTLNDHGAGSCSLCAACSLTVAVGPCVPQLQPPNAAYAAYPVVDVAAVRNVADGLERPPRTI